MGGKRKGGTGERKAEGWTGRTRMNSKGREPSCAWPLSYRILDPPPGNVSESWTELNSPLMILILFEFCRFTMPWGSNNVDEADLRMWLFSAEADPDFGNCQVFSNISRAWGLEKSQSPS